MIQAGGECVLSPLSGLLWRRGATGDGLGRRARWLGGRSSQGRCWSWEKLRLFLGHSHQSLSRGRFKFSLQTAVDVCWLPPPSNTVMHLHSQHRLVFVLKD